MNGNTKGALLALAGFGVFATHDVIVKSLGESMHAVQIVFFSVLFSFPLTTLVLIRDTSGGSLVPRHPWWTALRTAATVLTGLSAFYAFSTLPFAQTYAILFAAPLIITILSIPILAERVRLRRWLAVLVGLAGVIVVLRPGSTDLTLGHLAALVAAGSSALASVIVRKIGHEERSIVLLLYPMLANFVLMAALIPFVYVPVTLPQLGGLALMSVMALIAMTCMIGAYKAGEAVIVAPMHYSQILWATVYGALFFQETPDGYTILGTTIIVASGLYIVLREGRVNTSDNTPVLRTRTRFETGTGLRIGPLIRLRATRK